MGQSTREFAKTLGSAERKGKIDIRQRVLELFNDAYAPFNEDRQFKMLTLGSMEWIFEKKLLSEIFRQYPDQKKRGITLKSFEYDWKMFCIAAMNIPSGRYAPIKQEISDLNYQVIKSNVGRQLFSVNHIEVFEYLSKTDNMFDFMWIDLTSPIDFVQDKLIHAANRLLPGATLILSFSKGREREKISDRVAFVMDRLQDQMKFVENIEYIDTVAMINIVMTKRYTLLDYENLSTL